VSVHGSALVTDSSLRTALYTIRSLGRRGVRITAAERAGPANQDLGGLSRYVTRRVVVPDNHAQPEAFVDAILDLAPGHDVLMPIGMHSIGPVAQRAAEFSGIRMALAPWSTIACADNTRALLHTAAELGMPQPRRFLLRDYTSPGAREAIPLPVIVKTGIEAGLAPSQRYAVARTHPELEAAVARMRLVTDDPIIQELIRGDGIGVEALFDFEHRPVAIFCHRRLREYPLSGGPSTYCESIRHPVAEELALGLLRHLRWVGLAMVEFKVDRVSGAPMLMEINPRPWGSMALPIAAGVDFPWLAYRLARDGAVHPSLAFPDGVRLRFLVNDIQAAVAQVRAGAGLRPLASLADPRVHEGILSLADPRPSAAYLRKAWRAIVRGAADGF
jgi:predicted ATP-grasp superfamily ATP-dependent carboligase